MFMTEDHKRKISEGLKRANQRLGKIGQGLQRSKVNQAAVGIRDKVASKAGELQKKVVHSEANKKAWGVRRALGNRILANDPFKKSPLMAKKPVVAAASTAAVARVVSKPAAKAQVAKAVAAKPAAVKKAKVSKPKKSLAQITKEAKASPMYPSKANAAKLPGAKVNPAQALLDRSPVAKPKPKSVDLKKTIKTKTPQKPTKNMAEFYARHQKPLFKKG